MREKSRIAGGICLLAVFACLALSACAPSPQAPAPLAASVSVEQVQPVLYTEEPVTLPTEEPGLSLDEPAVTSPPPTSPPKPAVTVETIATARSAITLGDPRTVEGAGFSFRPVIGYDLHLKPEQATLVNEDGTIILSMTGVSVESVGPLEDRLEQLLGGVGEGMEEFEAGSPHQVKVGEKSGLATEVTGLLSGEKFSGQVVMVAASDSQLFYAIALVIEQPGLSDSLSEGDQAIEAIIESVTFVDPDIQ